MKTIAGFLLATLLLSACSNTFHGMGQDIRRGEEKVKEAATNVQQKIHTATAPDQSK